MSKGVLYGVRRAIGWPGTKVVMEASDALLFVGAAGIAVRAIAPHVASKATDSAVVVIDEAGRFAVPLLSGHLGGANELAQTVARAVGAIPVITTATDVRGVWAVDTWARCAGLAVSNPEAIKRVSARLLSGGRVALYSDMPISGQPPEGVDIASDRARADIVVSPFAGANAGAFVRAAETTDEVVPSVSPSDFVRATVGVDNVCERAALAGGGKLIFPKLAHGGVTVAFSKVSIELSFKER